MDNSAKSTQLPKKTKKSFLDRIRLGQSAEKLDQLKAWELTNNAQEGLLFLEKCVNWLRENNAHLVEGPFRKSGDENTIQELQQQFRVSADFTIPDTYEVHVVCSLLKRFLREMEQPLIPFKDYPTFIALGEMSEDTKEEQLNQVAFAVFMLPVDSRKLLQLLFSYLHELAQHSATTKMTEANLAIVIAPNILRPQVSTPLSVIGDWGRAMAVTELLITCVHQIFREPANPAKNGQKEFSDSMRLKYVNVQQSTKAGLVRAIKRKIADESLFQEPNHMRRDSISDPAQVEVAVDKLTETALDIEGDLEDLVQQEIQRIMSQFESYESSSSAEPEASVPSIPTPTASAKHSKRNTPRQSAGSSTSHETIEIDTPKTKSRSLTPLSLSAHSEESPASSVSPRVRMAMDPTARSLSIPLDQARKSPRLRVSHAPRNSTESSQEESPRKTPPLTSSKKKASPTSPRNPASGLSLNLRYIQASKHQESTGSTDLSRSFELTDSKKHSSSGRSRGTADSPRSHEELYPLGEELMSDAMSRSASTTPRSARGTPRPAKSRSRSSIPKLKHLDTPPTLQTSTDSRSAQSSSESQTLRRTKSRKPRTSNSVASSPPSKSPRDLGSDPQTLKSPRHSCQGVLQSHPRISLDDKEIAAEIAAIMHQINTSQDHVPPDTNPT